MIIPVLFIRKLKFKVVKVTKLANSKARIEIQVVWLQGLKKIVVLGTLLNEMRAELWTEEVSV